MGRFQLIARRIEPDNPFYRGEGDALQMLAIRNSCRAFMTRNQAEISEAEQLEWWPRMLADGAITCFLFFLADSEELSLGIMAPAEGHPLPVGYGIIRLADGKRWVTGGLLPEQRGKGFGSALFAHLAAQTSEDTWLEVLHTNVAGRRTYEKLGYVEVSRDERISTMCRPGGHFCPPGSHGSALRAP